MESITSLYEEKYTKEIESLTEIIDICLLEGSIHDKQNKEMVISSLKKRININCTIQKYEYVFDDIDILQRFDVDIDTDKELFLAFMEAKFALVFQNTINKVEQAENEYDWNLKSIITNLKSVNIKQVFQRMVNDQPSSS